MLLVDYGSKWLLYWFPRVSLWLNWLMVCDIKWELASNIKGWWTNREGQMLSMFLSSVLSLLFAFSQRQKDGDHILIKAEWNNDTDNQNRDRPKTWSVPRDSQKHRDNTLPAPFFHLICLLLVHFIPSLNPHSFHSLFLCSFPPSRFASFHPSVCVCFMCEGRCLPAGCQVTGLIEGPLESRCYQSLNPLFRLPLAFFLLFAPYLFSIHPPTFFNPGFPFFISNSIIFPILRHLSSLRKPHVVLISTLSLCCRYLFCYCFIPAFLLLSLSALWRHFLRLSAAHPAIFLSLHLVFIYHETWQEILISLHNRSHTQTNSNPPYWHANTNM